MEENIKINEYVRTKDGVIGKVGEIVKYKRATYKNRYFSKKVTHIENGIVIDKELIAIQKDIVKHSFNIIDLIEVGDLVQIHDRGNRIYQVDRDYQGKLAIIDVDWNEYEELYNEDIKSIVTREMMESVEYRIE